MDYVHSGGGYGGGWWISQPQYDSLLLGMDAAIAELRREYTGWTGTDIRPPTVTYNGHWEYVVTMTSNSDPVRAHGGIIDFTVSFTMIPR